MTVAPTNPQKCCEYYLMCSQSKHKADSAFALGSTLCHELTVHTLFTLVSEQIMCKDIQA